MWTHHRIFYQYRPSMDKYNPKYLKGISHTNITHFITQMMQICFDIIDNRIKPKYCILVMRDNTSSMVQIKI